MTPSPPFTDDERALLVSDQFETQLSVRQLAEHFSSTPGIIKRCQRQIRAGKPDVYLISPPRIRQKIGYRYCAKIVSPHNEAQESPFGMRMHPVSACESHLEDLKRWHAPLRRAS
jgi:hypothetical protein